jgi:hypothetical protein
LLIDNSANDGPNLITHNITNVFIGLDIDNLKLVNFVVAYTSPKNTEGQNGYFLNAVTLNLKTVDFTDDETEIMQKSISQFNSDISGLKDLVISTGMINELFHANLSLITETGTTTTGFFPLE